MRLDKFLKVSRIIKRRTVANEACDAGRVLVNGKVARASYDVKIGDIIDIYYVRNSYDDICKIKRKKLNLSIDLIYDKYNKILDMYNKSK